MVHFDRLLASDTHGILNIWDRRMSDLPCLELTTNSRCTLNSIQLHSDNQVNNILKTVFYMQASIMCIPENINFVPFYVMNSKLHCILGIHYTACVPPFIHVWYSNYFTSCSCSLIEHMLILWWGVDGLNLHCWCFPIFGLIIGHGKCRDKELHKLFECCRPIYMLYNVPIKVLILAS